MCLSASQRLLEMILKDVQGSFHFFYQGTVLIQSMKTLKLAFHLQVVPKPLGVQDCILVFILFRSGISSVYLTFSAAPGNICDAAGKWALSNPQIRWCSIQCWRFAWNIPSILSSSLILRTAGANSDPGWNNAAWGWFYIIPRTKVRRISQGRVSLSLWWAEAAEAGTELASNAEQVRKSWLFSPLCSTASQIMMQSRMNI